MRSTTTRTAAPQSTTRKPRLRSAACERTFREIAALGAYIRTMDADDARAFADSLHRAAYAVEN